MSISEIMESMGQWCKGTIRKLNASLKRRCYVKGLRKTHAQVSRLCQSAERHRSNINRALRKVEILIESCGCDKEADGVSELVHSVEHSWLRLQSNEISAMAGKHARVENMGELDKCENCKQRTLFAKHLKTSLLDVNNVVRTLYDDIDLLEWLIKIQATCRLEHLSNRLGMTIVTQCLVCQKVNS